MKSLHKNKMKKCKHTFIKLQPENININMYLLSVSNYLNKHESEIKISSLSVGSNEWILMICAAFAFFLDTERP